MSHVALTRLMMQSLRESPEPWRRVGLALRDAVVEHARCASPYYRDVAGRDVPFEEIPVLTKAILTERFGDILARGVPPSQRVDGATGGSTGEPTRYAADKAALPAHLAAFYTLREIHEIPENAPVVFLIGAPTGQPLPPDWVPALVGGLTADRVEPLVRGWEALQRYWVYGAASFLERIADDMDVQGIRLTTPPIAVVTSQDMLSDDGRPRIAAAFGCPVHSWYGSQETSPWLAGTLQDGVRYAFNPLLAHLELLDDDGRPVGVGETGRVVVTDLHNRVCPMIRYDTQDLAVRSADAVGAWPVIGRLEGRSSELLRFPSGRAISAATLAARLVGVGKVDDRIRFYQCLQRGPNALELRLVWRRTPTPADEHAMAEALRPAVDPDTRIDVVAVSELETLPSGKRWIVRRLPQGG